MRSSSTLFLGELLLQVAKKDSKRFELPDRGKEKAEDSEDYSMLKHMADQFFNVEDARLLFEGGHE